MSPLPASIRPGFGDCCATPRSKPYHCFFPALGRNDEDEARGRQVPVPHAARDIRPCLLQDDFSGNFRSDLLVVQGDAKMGFGVLVAWNTTGILCKLSPQHPK